MKRIITLATFLLLFTDLIAQDKESRSKMNQMFVDSTDQYFDFSEFLLSQTGFMPYGSIITEPALDYGLVLGGVFFNPFSKYRKQEIREAWDITGNPPDILYAFGFGTLNKSWGTIVGYNGHWLKDKIRYRGAIGWLSVNLDYYGNENVQLPKPITFNYKGLPIIQGLDYAFIKNVYIGASYSWFKYEISLSGDDLPEFISKQSLTGTLTTLSPQLYYDKRDNIFSPKKGIYSKGVWNISRPGLGSDFTYDILHAFFIGYIPFATDSWVLGLRADARHSTDGTPFFAQPFLDTRGIPAMRFQGTNTVLMESELTWYFHRRWGVNGFAGIGRAFSDLNQFSDFPSYMAGGIGFRYLAARALGLYTGIDLAYGPEGFAIYIIFGNAWNRY